MSTTPTAIIVVLGADRVGKSTIVNNTIEQFKNANIDAISLHFAGPQPHHDSPIQQYTESLDRALDTMPEVIICDRGFSEVCFYDKFRRHVDISEEWAFAAESYFASRTSNLYVFLIKRSWEWSKPHHIIEIQEQYPNATQYFIRNQLLMREAEHYAYYEYMEDYLKNRSLLPHKTLDLGYREPPNLSLLISDV
jgi:hypothetical protein